MRFRNRRGSVAGEPFEALLRDGGDDGVGVAAAVNFCVGDCCEQRGPLSVVADCVDDVFGECRFEECRGVAFCDACEGGVVCGLLWVGVFEVDGSQSVEICGGHGGGAADLLAHAGSEFAQGLIASGGGPGGGSLAGRRRVRVSRLLSIVRARHRGRCRRWPVRGLSLLRGSRRCRRRGWRVHARERRGNRSHPDSWRSRGWPPAVTGRAGAGRSRFRASSRPRRRRSVNGRGHCVRLRALARSLTSSRDQ